MTAPESRLDFWNIAMSEAAATASPTSRAIDSSFLLRVFYVFAALAVLSFGISVGGKWLGRSIALAGHTDDTTVREVVIGNNVIAAPANTIRFERQRHDGVATRLDLYLRWPQLDGYTNASRDDFNNTNGARSILFLSFEERMMSRDMSGRLEPIYRPMLVHPGQPGPDGVTLFPFTEKSGYLDEVLAVAAGATGEPFVARCLAGESAAESLAPCERDIHLGDNLSLTYRFPRELLGDWEQLDKAIRAKASSMSILNAGG